MADSSISRAESLSGRFALPKITAAAKIKAPVKPIRTALNHVGSVKGSQSFKAFGMVKWPIVAATFWTLNAITGLEPKPNTNSLKKIMLTFTPSSTTEARMTASAVATIAPAIRNCPRSRK